MARISDGELMALIEGALTRNRSDKALRREDIESAAVGAAKVARALREAGLLVIRDERKGRRNGFSAPDAQNGAPREGTSCRA